MNEITPLKIWVFTWWGNIYFIEWLAGGEHYRNFKAYIEKGGLPELLSGITLTEVQRHYFGRHGIVLLLLRREEV